MYVKNHFHINNASEYKIKKMLSLKNSKNYFNNYIG